MEENENIYDKIRELIGALPGSMNILEEEIDLDVQMNYFDSSRKFKKEYANGDDPGSIDDLLNEDISLDQKKDILLKLASKEEVSAFRDIQKFLETYPGELRDWALLALQESKMLLESKLLDENQIFISTGLGGKGQKLRYFVVVLGNQINEFSDLQRKIIKEEFDYTLKKHNAEAENFEFSGDMATILAVIPLQVPVKAVFEEAIEECNSFGGFIQQDFVITNVKKLTFREIKDFLNQRKFQKKNEEDIEF